MRVRLGQYRRVALCARWRLAQASAYGGAGRRRRGRRGARKNSAKMQNQKRKNPQKPSLADFTIQCIHNAPQSFADLLNNMWSAKHWTEAYQILAKPDVDVTNASDKTKQLGKIPLLQVAVQRVMAAVTVQRWARGKRLRRKCASQVASGSVRLEAALEPPLEALEA